ncbi:MAG TPA: hypothetical protein VGS07_24375 [Thermoanaerobaculia bacterium]|nr:hypothetical protein [Thermoanaerobaculia bacterium]
MRNRSILAALVLSLLAGLSPLAADSTIQRGIDVFTTKANGATYLDFAQNPLPAGFFCESSKAFTGRVALKGLPLATGAPGQIWGSDTVIERLDDADFDANDVAVTRIQFRALSLVSVAPIKTACGLFHVYVSLAGPQRTTNMTINRTEEGGGNFVAPLAVNARVSFISVKPARTKSARALELTRSFTFPANPLPWSFPSNAKAKRISSALVDTNGDQAPDALLPGASNFVAGRSPVRRSLNKIYAACDPCAPWTCHNITGEEHCTAPVQPPECQNLRARNLGRLKCGAADRLPRPQPAPRDVDQMVTSR